MSLTGLYGRPYIDLMPLLDPELGAPGGDWLFDLDQEICLGLISADVRFTGGSHRSMGIQPPSLSPGPYVDYGEVLRDFTRDEFAAFAALSDTPAAFDLDRFRDYTIGEERDYPLSARQMRYLQLRYGVYFPWQIFYEMIPTRSWADKSSAAGKSFTAEALRLFPRTVALCRRLPFAEIGRCNIMGLLENHDGTVHRDGEPEEQGAPDHFITLCPRGNKRLFLWDEDARAPTFVPARAYWFNDHDYHGVAADPFFRYSLRVDGVFRPDFLRRIERATLDGLP